MYFPYVSSKKGNFAKVLLVLTIFYLFGCVSMGNKASSEKEKKVLDAQIDVVVNYLNEAQPERAHVELKVMLQKYPEESRLQNLMGLAYLALNEPALAEGYLRKAVDLEDLPGYQLNLSSALIEQKKYAAALKLLRKIVVTQESHGYPFPERVFHNMGLAYERLEKTNLAVKYYRKALAESPRHYTTLLQMAFLYLKKNDSASAKQYLEMANESCASCFEPVKQLAFEYLRSNHRAAAYELVQRYLKLSQIPDHDRSEAQKFVAKLEIKTDPESKRSTKRQ